METIVMNQGMLVSGIILAASFILIFTETLHGFHRVKVAMAGAAVMLVVGQSYGFYSPEEAFEAVDWNVVFLLGSMMAVVAIMVNTGGFEVLAANIGRIAKGRQFLLLALLGTAVTVISLLLDNVTTVVIFGPLIVLICQKMKVSAIPYLLAAALLSDTGGVATLVGDPPNLMIGSAFDIAFMPFAYKMFPIVFVAWIATLFFMRYLFKEELAIVPEGKFEDSIPYKDKSLWNKSLSILGLMVILFVIHNTIHWEPWMVAGTGLILLVVLAKEIEFEDVMKNMTHEIPLLMFFVALFMLVGGVEGSKFLEYLGQYIIPFLIDPVSGEVIQENFMYTCIALMWVAAIMSAAIDNIPFTAAMIPIIASLETVGVNIAALCWCLAIGVGMGGNGTHIGSTANVYIVTVSEKLAKSTGNPDLAITPLKWAKKGLPVMVLTLAICTVIMYLFFDYYSLPLHP
ncbi:MAG: SLC13 family permease [Gammaproteobacteria bacterium]|jgi:Na+/H+ antiporter NhaD/arsenite permease-like protein|tara:strand:- start:720 stop:2090 length:1371 start_codon:yes stop_codon:yes gene_type:complete